MQYRLNIYRATREAITDTRLMINIVQSYRWVGEWAEYNRAKLHRKLKVMLLTALPLHFAVLDMMQFSVLPCINVRLGNQVIYSIFT